MDLQLTDKKAIVTGASRGIGRAIAQQLALEGTTLPSVLGRQDRCNAAAELARSRDAKSSPSSPATP